jgi:hypothetical protein
MQENYGLDLSGKTVYVYFMQIGDDGPIKIGFTKNIRHRLSVVQIGNPALVRLIAVTDGGRAKEFELHNRFKKYRLYGEWFEPNQELLEYISQFKPLNIVSSDFQKPIKRGNENHNWKGDLACRASKQQRARAYTRYKKKCDRCGLSKGIDTIFLDGNKDNLEQSNLAFYCRRCRMEKDGTLNVLKEVKHQKKDPRPCKICNILSTNFWYGRCHTCNEFFRRNGFERSEKLPKEDVFCKICNTKVKYPAHGKCHTCYEFFRKNGFERNEINNETDEIKTLRNFSGKMTLEKAVLIRKLHHSKYTNQFIAKAANISISYLNDILSNRYFGVKDEYEKYREVDTSSDSSI